MALTVLVVDDSDVMRKMIIRTLNLCGLDLNRIYEAGDGRRGLEILDRQWVDLLFLDVNMPVMDGMEMLEIIRTKPDTQDLPVLMISTESNPGRIRTFDEKAAGFVHKPFTPERLREKVESILQMKRPAE